jgi:predicted Zn-dependent protease
MLAAAAGYDPMGMSTFLASMRDLERLSIGHARVPSFVDTHPGSAERAASCAARAREIRWKRDPSLGDTRAAHLRRVEGIALGARPEGGVFVGSRFLHPDLDFQLLFPNGWQLVNTHTAVGAASPRGDAVVFLTAEGPAGDPRAAAEAFAAKAKQEAKLSVVKSHAIKIGRIDAWRLELEGGSGGQQVAAHVTLFPYRGAMHRITGATPVRLKDQYLGQTRNTARSFRPLTAEERASIQATRLRLATARAGEELAELGRRAGNAWDPSRTAVLNGIFATHRFAGGENVKIARTEPYTSEPR